MYEVIVSIRCSLFGLVMLFSGMLDAQSQQEVLKRCAEDFRVEKHLDLSGSIVGYDLPTGVNAKIVATTDEQVVGFDGAIRRPISDVKSLVTFELSKGNEKVLTQPQEIVIEGRMKSFGGNKKPGVVPALREWVGSNGSYWLKQGASVVLSSQDAQKGRPTLAQRMEIFAHELSQMAGYEVPVVVGVRPCIGDIVVQLSDGAEEKRIGNEGYVLSVQDTLLVRSVDSLGAYWSTRSILQVFAQHGMTFPKGDAVDYPRYALRGFMYDVARKPATLDAVKSVVETMAYYKLNDLQLHLNDNFIWLHDYTRIPNGRDASEEDKRAAIAEVLAASPTAFRLESDMVGKDGTKLASSDHFYTKEDFGKLIDQAEVYGVQIVPELDVPGHAMSFTSVRPDLMYRGKVHKPHDVERAAMLDASKEVNPATGRPFFDDTMDFVKVVFDEYLVGKDGKPPVFRNSVVHIGADEYYGAAEDYRAFADELLRHVKERGFTPRLWGSMKAKPGKTPVVSEGVQMHIWSRDWQLPQDAIDAGYDIINILDANTYIVPNGTGNVGAYGDLLDLAALYAPDWQPNVMEQFRVLPGHPRMLGAQWALWNDNSFRRDRGLTDYDLYDRIRNTCAVMAEKTWSTGEDRGFADFQKLVKEVSLPVSVRAYFEVQSKTDEVLSYAFDQDKVQDASPNEYHAVAMKNVQKVAGYQGSGHQLNGGTSYIQTPLGNMAPEYRIECWVKRESQSKEEQVLFSSRTAEVLAVHPETGKMGIRSEGWEFCFDYALPVGEWVKLSFVGKNRELTLTANGKLVGSPERLKFPSSYHYKTFVFPLEMIGAKQHAFKGTVDELKVRR